MERSRARVDADADADADAEVDTVAELAAHTEGEEASIASSLEWCLNGAQERRPDDGDPKAGWRAVMAGTLKFGVD